jgi:hypothetical protein
VDNRRTLQPSTRRPERNSTPMVVLVTAFVFHVVNAYM